MKLLMQVEGQKKNWKKKEIVEKVLRSLPMIYNPKISTLEDRENIDKLTMNELQGILIAYEMRIGQDNSQKKDSTFNASKIAKKSETKIQSKDSDDEEALLVKTLRMVYVSTKGNYP